MYATGTIVAATDFSEYGNRAAQRAARVVAETGTSLQLVHVVSRSSLDALRDLVPDPAMVEKSLLSGVEQALSTQAEALAREYGIVADFRVVTGELPGGVFASTPDTSLVVVGARGASPMRELLLGTTAVRLLGRVPCPLLVVRKPAHTPYVRALAAVDLHAGSDAVVQTALRFAPKAIVQPCHAYDVLFEGRLSLAGVREADLEHIRGAARDRATFLMSKLTAGVADQRVAAAAVRQGDPTDVVMCQAAEWDADVVVVGRRSTSAIGNFLIGSTTRHLLAHSLRDVLVVDARAHAAT